MLGIQQTVYSRYERGAQNIPLELLLKLADFYGTSTDYILGRTNEIRPYPRMQGRAGANIIRSCRFLYDIY